MLRDSIKKTWIFVIFSILAVFLFAGFAFATYLNSNGDSLDKADDEFKITDVSKSFAWDEGKVGQSGKVNLQSAVQGKGSVVPPRILIMGTLCGTHGLTKDTIEETINTVAGYADVDYFLYSNGYSRSTDPNEDEDNINFGDEIGTLSKGGSFVWTNPDIINFFRDNDDKLPTSNHQTLNKFLKTVYETRDRNYDFVIIEFDGGLVVHRYGADNPGHIWSVEDHIPDNWKNYDNPQYEKEAEAAEILKGFYENNRVMWITPDDGNVEHGVEVPKFFPSKHIILGGLELSLNSFMFNALMALVHPQDYKLNPEEADRDHHPEWDLDYGKDEEEFHLTYGNKAKLLPSLKKSLDKLFKFKVEIEDALYAKKGLKITGANLYYRDSEEDDWIPAGETTFSVEDGKVEACYDTAIFKNLIKVVINFEAEYNGKKFTEESDDGNPNNGTLKVKISADGEDPQYAETEIDEPAVWPIVIHYESNNESLGSVTNDIDDDILVNTPINDPNFIGSEPDPKPGANFVGWKLKQKDGSYKDVEFVDGKPAQHVATIGEKEYNRNVEGTYVAFFEDATSIDKSANVESAKGGQDITYNIDVFNDSDEQITDGLVQDTLNTTYFDLSDLSKIEVTPESATIDASTGLIRWDNAIVPAKSSTGESGHSIFTIKAPLKRDITASVPLNNTAKFSVNGVEHSDTVSVAVSPRDVTVKYNFSSAVGDAAPTDIEPVVDSGVYPYSGSYSPLAQDNVPAGFVFDGWYKDNNCTEKVLGDITLTSDVNNLYGKWTAPTITKSVNATSVKAGTILTYTITVNNPSTVAIPNLVVTDENISSDLANISPSEHGAYDDASRKITWNLTNVAPGSTNVSFTAETLKTLDMGDTITNSAKMTINADQFTSNEVSTTINEEYMLDIEYNYVSGLKPTGATPPTESAKKYGSEYTSLEPAKYGGYKFNGWYTNPDMADDHKYIDGTVIQDNLNLYGSWELATDISKQMTSSTPICAGDTMTYSVKVTNNSDDTINGLYVVDGPIDNCIDSVTEITNGGVFDTNTRNITWDLAEQTLAVGSSITFRFTANIKDIIPAGKTVVNNAKVRIDGHDISAVPVETDIDQLFGQVKYNFVSSCTPKMAVKPADATNLVYGTNYTCVQPDAVPGYVFKGWYTSSDLSPEHKITAPFEINTPVTNVYGGFDTAVSINKSASIAAVAAGGTLTYTISVTNSSPANLSNVVVVDPELDDVLAFQDATPTPSEVDGSKLQWNNISIAAGNTFHITINVKVDDGADEDYEFNNVAQVSFGPDDDIKTLTSNTVTTTVSDVVLYDVKYHYVDSIKPSDFSPFEDPTTKTYHVQHGHEFDSYSFGPIAGYKFNGWYTDPDLKDEHKFTDHSRVYENLDLYGKWSVDLEIEKTLEPKDKYSAGDEFSYTIKVTNNSDVAVNNIKIIDTRLDDNFDKDTLLVLDGGEYIEETRQIVWDVSKLSPIAAHASFDVHFKVKVKNVINPDTVIINDCKFEFDGNTINANTVSTPTEQLFGHVKYQHENAPASAVLPDESPLLAFGTSYEISAQENVGGYIFDGWYTSNDYDPSHKCGLTYVINEHETILYGKFTPAISIEKAQNKDSLKAGEQIKYKITLNNNSDLPATVGQVEDVVSEKLENVVCDTATVSSDNTLTWTDVVVPAKGSTSLIFSANALKGLDADETIKNTASYNFEGNTGDSETTSATISDVYLLQVNYHWIDSTKPESAELPLSTTVQYGKTLTPQYCDEVGGFTFDGWYTSATKESKFVDGSEIIQDTDLYGQWSMDTEISKSLTPADLSSVVVTAGDKVRYDITVSNNSDTPINHIKIVDGLLDESLDLTTIEIDEGGSLADGYITWDLSGTDIIPAKDTIKIGFTVNIKTVVSSNKKLHNVAKFVLDNINTKTSNDVVTPVNQLKGNVHYSLIDAPTGVIPPADSLGIPFGEIYVVQEQTLPDGYIFEGWYFDDALTDIVPDNFTIDQLNVTLYGKLIPSIAIDKTANKTNITAGDSITYNLLVTNSSGRLASNVTVTDKLPEGLEYVSSEPAGVFDESSNTITWSDLTINASQQILINVTSDKELDAGSIDNTAKCVVGPLETSDTASVDVAEKHVSVIYKYKSGGLVPSGMTLPSAVNDIKYNTIYECAEDQTCAGYRFLGWFSDPECSERYVNHKMTEEKTTIYGDWESAITSEKNIIFDDPEQTSLLAGGTASYTFDVNNDSDEAITCDIFDKLDSTLLNPTDITPDGVYDNTQNTIYWNGFTIEANSKATFTFNAQVSENILSLHAKAINKTSVTYDGHTYNSNVVDTPIIPYVNVTYDYTGIVPAAAIVPEPDLVHVGDKFTATTPDAVAGYKFNGWYTDPDCAEEHKFIDESTVTENMNLYGQWIFDMSIEKKIAAKEVYTAGDTFKYTISVINNSDLDVETGQVFDMKLDDNFDDKTLFLPAEEGGSYDFTTRQIKWEITEDMAVPAKGSLDLHFNVDVLKVVAPNTMIKNDSRLIFEDNVIDAETLSTPVQQLLGKVHYELFDSPKEAIPPADSDFIPFGDKYVIPDYTPLAGYTFDGWYLDDELTEKAPVSLDIDKDITNLFGKLVPAVNISKTADKASIVAGENITYTIDIQNISGTALNNVSVVDNLPVVAGYWQVKYLSSEPAGVYDEPTNTISWSGLSFVSSCQLKVVVETNKELDDGSLIENNVNCSVGPLTVGDTESVAVGAKYVSVEYRYKEGLTPSGITPPEPVTDIKYNTEYNCAPYQEYPGYKFLGWFSDEACKTPYVNHKMTAENTIIYGAWDTALKLDKSIDWKESTVEQFLAGGKAYYQFNVSNSSAGAITCDVFDNLDDNLSDAFDISGDGVYNKADNSVSWSSVNIDANSTVTFKFAANVTDEMTPEHSNVSNKASLSYDKNVYESNVVTAPIVPYVSVEYQFTGDVPADITPPETAKVHKGDAFTTIKPENADGYKFNGWFVDTDCTVPFLDGSPINNDTILHGLWTQDIATFMYYSQDINKGGVSVETETTKVVTGTPTGSTAIPKPGYKFKEWIRESDGTVVGNDPTYIPEKVDGMYVDDKYKAVFESAITSAKVVDKETCLAGEELTYTIYVNNDSGQTVTDLYVSDVVPAGLESITPLNGGVYDGTTIVWHVLNLTSDIQFVQFKAKVPSTILTSTTYTNMANVYVGKIDPVAVPDATSNKIQTTADPLTTDIVVNKVWSDGDNLHKGQSLKVNLYADTIDKCVDSLTLSDDTYYDTVSWADKFAPQRVYDLDGHKISYFVRELNSDNIPVDENGIYKADDNEYKAHYSYITDFGGRLISASINNSYQIKPTDITLDKTADKSYSRPGDDITYTLTVGYIPEGSHAQNIGLEDIIPDGLEYVIASGNAKYDKSQNKVNWTIDKVSKDEPATVTLVCHVPDDVKCASFKNVAYITSFTNYPKEEFVTKNQLFPQDKIDPAIDIRKSILRTDEDGNEYDYLRTNEEVGSNVVLRYYAFKYSVDEMENVTIEDTLPAHVIPPEPGHYDGYTLKVFPANDNISYKVKMTLDEPLKDKTTSFNLDVVIDPDLKGAAELTSASKITAQATVKEEAETFSADSNSTTMVVVDSEVLPDPIPSPPVVIDVKSINVAKVWSDGLDVHNSDVVSVSLFANGVEFDKQDLSAGNDWNYTWIDLPVKNADGSIVVYTLKENSIFDDYQSVVTQTKEGDFIVDNNKILVPPVIPDPVNPVVQEVTPVNFTPVQTSDMLLTLMFVFGGLSIIGIVVLAVRARKN